MDKDYESLPEVVSEYIKSVIKKMRYKKRVRAEVREELSGHFADALKGCADENKEQAAKELIEGFGDAKMLAILIRRGKKRNRPMWKKAVIGCVKGVGILFVLFFVYMLWFISGKPEISVDYLEVLNKLNRPEVADVDNGWANYENAGELYVFKDEQVNEVTKKLKFEYGLIGDLEKLSDEEKTTFYKYLDDNRPAWDEFVKGSGKPYAYREYGYGEGVERKEDKWTLSILLPHLSAVKNICKVGAWNALIDAEEGRVEQGLSKCMLIIMAGKHLKSNVILIDQLGGIAMERIGHKVITEIVAEKEVSPSVLKQLYEQLAEIYADGYPEINMAGERLFFLDCVQHMYTKGGPGGGHLVPEKMGAMLFDFDVSWFEDEEGLAGFVQDIAIGAVGVVLARRNETLAKGNELYDYLESLTQYTPHQRKMRNIKKLDDRLQDLSFRYMFIKELVPAIEKVSNYHYKSRANYEGTLMIIAVLRYEKENGNLPASLDALVEAGYIQSVPMDPYSDGALVYKKTDGGFMLYSVSNNFIDDGGEYGTNRKGGKRMWGENGDAVFWPVRN